MMVVCSLVDFLTVEVEDAGNRPASSVTRTLPSTQKPIDSLTGRDAFRHAISDCGMLHAARVQ